METMAAQPVACLHCNPLFSLWHQTISNMPTPFRKLTVPVATVPVAMMGFNAMELGVSNAHNNNNINNNQLTKKFICFSFF